MTPEERIAALETQAAQNQTYFQQTVDMMQFLGGSERVFQAALLALIRKHPHKEVFHSEMVERIERAFVAVHFDANNESHQQGAEQARNLILLALRADEDDGKT